LWGTALRYFGLNFSYNEEDNLEVVRRLIGMTSWTSKNFNNRKSKNLEVYHAKFASIALLAGQSPQAQFFSTAMSTNLLKTRK